MDKKASSIRGMISNPANFQHMKHISKSTELDLSHNDKIKEDPELSEYMAGINGGKRMSETKITTSRDKEVTSPNQLLRSFSPTHLLPLIRKETKGGLPAKKSLDTDLKRKETKLSPTMISSPTNYTHVHHAENGLEAEVILYEEEEGDTTVTQAIAKLFGFTTKTARQKALRGELSRLSSNEQKKMKEEYLLHESRLVAKRMSVNDFEIIKIIGTLRLTLGHGGFGIVRLVREKTTGEVLAMKSLTKTVTMERGQEEHVKAERSLLSLASEMGDWIVRLFYSFQDKENLYFVLEYMPGGDLLGLLIRKDTFSEEFARFYFAEIVLSIEEVHKLGMIHRDIKVVINLI